MSKMKSLSGMNKTELMGRINKLSSEKTKAVDAFVVVQETLQKVVQERMAAREELEETKERLRLAHYNVAQIATANATRMGQVLEDDKKQKLTIDEMRIVAMQREEAFNRVDADNTFAHMELRAIRSTLFSPALMVCLHQGLKDERFAGKKKKIEQLIENLGGHMTTACSHDPGIWRLMAEELY